MPRLLLPALALLLAACTTPAADEAATAAPLPFVGTVRVLEHHYVLGIRRTEYVTLSFDGPRLRREVRPRGFDDPSERYGVIADLRADSVTYYVQAGKLNGYHRLPRAAYLAKVAANERLIAGLDQKPYSTLFEPLPPGTPGLSSEAVAGAALSRLSSYRALLFLLPDATRCTVFYSDQIRVPPAMLPYLEHNPPAALPTLALAVTYTPPARPRSDGLLDRLEHGMQQLAAQETEFESFAPTAPADAFDLPFGSSPDLELSARPVERGSSGRRRHHWHD